VEYTKKTLKEDDFFKTIPDIDAFAELLHKTYKLNIDGELFKMSAWLIVNPKRRKRQYKRFIINWLNRAGNKRRY